MSGVGGEPIMHDSAAATVYEMTSYEVAQSVVAFSKQEHPDPLDWPSTRIARRHIMGLLSEIDRLRAHDHSAVEGCNACAFAEAMRRG